ncbi:hypothetical protein ACIQU2_21190 [Pseudomonas sp. NPDC098740]|uniref:hypothetical protein n=1 Tax=Pseudomonas sp. NPDC098740 TaxID=3364486 RepID=UPI00383B56AF
MTAQLKALEAPVLKEAVEGVLYVHNLIDPAHGVVWPYPYAAAGDNVEFTVQTSTGNTWVGSIALTQASVGKPVTFSIPKETFAKGLVLDATAKLQYSVTSASGNQARSADLVVQLKP